MIRIILGILALLAAVFIGLQLHHDNGYLLMQVNNWTIETPLWFAFLSIIVLFVAVYLLLSFAQYCGCLPKKFFKWRLRRRRKNANNTTYNGLIACIEGRWKAAEKYSVQAIPDGDTPLFNYLLAAHAAQKVGAFSRRDGYLQHALQRTPEAKVAVFLTKAELQIASGQWASALTSLQTLRELTPKNTRALELSQTVYRALGDWRSLATLLPLIKKHTSITSEAYHQLMLHTQANALTSLIAENNAPELNNCIENLPKSLLMEPAVVIPYCKYLLQQNTPKKAESVLRAFLRQSKLHNAEIIGLYITAANDKQELSFAESLLKKYPDSACLYLGLGQLAMRNQLWGKAHVYLQKSTDLEATPSAYFCLGQLQDLLGKKDQACGFFKRGLQLAVLQSA